MPVGSSSDCHLLPCYRLHEDGPCFRVVPGDLLLEVKHQLSSTCEQLVWMLDPDVLRHAECLLRLLIVLSRLI